MKDKIEQALVSKGWLRLWMVGSAIWVVYWSYEWYLTLKLLSYTIPEDYWIAFKYIFGAPMAVYVSGLVLRWIIRGFTS